MLTHQHTVANIVVPIAAIGVFLVCQILGTSSCMQHYLVEVLDSKKKSIVFQTPGNFFPFFIVKVGNKRDDASIVNLD